MTIPPLSPSLVRFRQKSGMVVGEVLFVGVLLVALATMAGFAGRWWWVLDLASHFRVQYVACLLPAGAVLLMVRQRRRAAVAGFLALLNAADILPLHLGGSQESDSPSLRVLVVNLHFSNRRHEAVIELARRENVDLVVATEVTDEWHEALESLSSQLPYRHGVPLRHFFGIGIWSRFPLGSAERVDGAWGIPMLVAEVDAPGSRWTVIAIHPPPPVGVEGHQRRDEQLTRAAELASKARSPLLVLGDFNATRWSPAFRALLDRASLRDGREGFGILPTWPASLPFAFRIPIDHCLVSPDVVVRRFDLGPDIGSDHLPIIAEVQTRGGQ